MKYDTAHSSALKSNDVRMGSAKSPNSLQVLRKKDLTASQAVGPTSRFVNPQAVQLSPGLVMGSQVSQRQKRDLAKYYTSLLGQKDQNSVNAYMQVEGQASAQQPARRRKKKQRKPRAQSHANNSQKMQGQESQKNLLTIENDRAEGGPVHHAFNYGIDDGEPDHQLM